MSKTPIREALALLKSEGLVVSEVQKGFIVFNMDEQELSEFCELRIALEIQALRSAIYNNKINLVIKLKKIVKQMEDSVKNSDLKVYDLLDSQFHKIFFILSENRYLLKHYESINGVIETIRTHTHNNKKNITGSLNDHKIILHTIEMNSISKAKKALENHINVWVNDRVKKSLIIK